MTEQPIVTIILPVSRFDYIQKVFASLEFLECDNKKTNIVAIVDGPPELFLKVREFVDSSKFNKRLTVNYSGPVGDSVTIFERRDRIASIHNDLKQYIGECKYVFGTEDDTYLPSHTLQYLLQDYETYPNAGFIEGVELGRWGTPYVGAWRADEIYDTTVIKSILPPDDNTISVEPIDAGGFYCFLTQRDIYVNHDFKTFENNAMGPDAEYGISIRRKGYSNFIDWDISCDHIHSDGVLKFGQVETRQVQFIKRRDHWSFNFIP